MIVAFDTAGPVAGVALWHEGQVLQRTERITRGAERRLVPWVVELCAEVGRPVHAITGVACVDGPGAFTGLRVGLATAGGMALALGVPLWTTSSLRTRAHRLHRSGGLVLCMLDARKSRVYAELRHGEVLREGPVDIGPEAALAWVDAPFVATGEGALVYRDLVETAGGRVVPDAEDPGVDALASLASVALAAGKGRDPATIQPRYLREPDAKPPRR
jgi:tRNA threonylcarbamoyladenosine biosynthesis protein TsaB